MAHVATVTIDSTKVSADLTDYVVYIDLSEMSPSFWGTVVNGGGDIRVYKSDGTTELAREVVSCDTSTRTGELHLKYSGTLSSSADTEIQIHADGTSSEPASTATYGSEAVWSDYDTVLHLQSDGTDSTGNSHTFSDTGTVTHSSSQLGSGADFGTAETAAMSRSTDPGNLVGGDNKTISLWVKNNQEISADNFMFFTTNTVGPTGDVTGVIYDYNSGTPQLRFYRLGTEGYVPSITNQTLGTTSHYLSYVYNGSTLTPYLDGSAVGSAVSTSGTFDNTGSPTRDRMDLGQQYNGTSRARTIVDEVRVRIGTRTSDWFSTEYNNQNSPSTFYTVTDANHVVTLTIDNTKVSADATDFPVYVDLSDLPTTGFWDVVANGGGDIRVTKADGTELAREVVSCDTATDTGELHFKYTGTLSSSADTEVYIIADGAMSDYAATDTYGRNAVWSGYDHVWHLSNAVDSTGNAATGTTSGVTFGTGKIGDTATFDGTSTGINIGSGMVDTNQNSDLSIQAWSKQSQSTGWILAHHNNSNFYSQKDLYILSTDLGMQINPTNSGTDQISVEDESGTNYGAGVWQMLHMTFSGNALASGVSLYKDGSGVTETTKKDNLSNTPPTGLPAFIGSRGAAGANYTGDIDEMRIAKTELTSTWISTEHNNQDSPSTFYSAAAVGGEEESTTFKNLLLIGVG